MHQIYGQYDQYQRQQDKEIQLANPIRLITLLLQGAVRFTKKAILCTEEGQSKEALENMDRASKIVVHLYNCLDFEKGGEISERLGSLYSYVIDCHYNFVKNSKDIGNLNSINEVLHTILDAWQQVEEKMKNA